MIHKRPERLRSSTRLVLVLFAFALTILTFIGKITGEQFMIAWGMVAGFFFGARRKDGTSPEI
ncbi:MAG: hypothetical protein Q4B28_08670 [bacterium]|nr:hypothetical protein [bacterium]